MAAVRVKLGVRANGNPEEEILEEYLSSMAHDQTLMETIYFDGSIVKSFKKVEV